jgi:ADP-heptose:LPS heptosyltransferase
VIKGHSAGVGDLLRSSAAWRALRNRFPESRLHLWFLTKNPGARSEPLMGRHHLLASFHVSDKRTHGVVGWVRLLREGRRVAQQTCPDLIVDCEPNGFRSAILTRFLKHWCGAVTVGVAEVYIRGWLYDRAAPSRKAYARRHEMKLPLEYTERDFVALAALEIERQGTAIELCETDEGHEFGTRVRREFGEANGGPLLGLNIGCGTPDALPKRPNLGLLAELIRELQRRHGFSLLLTGAAFEQDINREFLSVLRPAFPVLDLAGRTNILELAGVIAACRFFVSTDSGPYHMAVALRVPTLALFTWDNRCHFHHHPWIACVLMRNQEDVPGALDRAEDLMQIPVPLRTCQFSTGAAV